MPKTLHSALLWSLLAACASPKPLPVEVVSNYEPQADTIDLRKSSHLDSSNHLNSRFRRSTSIGLYFQINLLKYNKYSKLAAKQMSSKQTPLRKCYTKFHNVYKRTTKTAHFNMWILPSGKVSRTLFKGGGLKNIAALKCLHKEVSRLTFRLGIKKAIPAKLSLFFSTTPNQ